MGKFFVMHMEKKTSHGIFVGSGLFLLMEKIALYCGKSSLSTTPLVVLQIVTYRASPSREIGPVCVCVCVCVSVYVCLCIFMSGQ